MECFNSRAHEGRDDQPVINLEDAIVSIHAPTRGATLLLARACESWRFNSRAHEGRDLPIRPKSNVLGRFQFTRPRGARQCVDGLPSVFGKFQFTRPRGARRQTRSKKGLRKSFNSRAHEGRDGGYCIILLYWNARALFRELAGTHRPVRHQSLLFVMHATLSPFNTTSQNSLFHCQRATTVRLTPCTA